MRSTCPARRCAAIRAFTAACLALICTCGADFVQAAANLNEVTTACRVPGFKLETRCGSVERALDPAAPSGKKIAVQFIVVPALARNKRDDALFFFAGGPGQSAIKIAPQVSALLRRFNNQRDLVFIDQRGTGKTAPLLCPSDEKKRSVSEMLDVAAMPKQFAQCKAKLEALPYGDLRFFTTTIAMADADSVREKLGYDKINIAGASYGTRAVLEYQRQFPQRVRRAMIDGVAPPDMVLMDSIAVDANAALVQVFSACAQDKKCDTTFPNLKDSWQSLLTSLPKTAMLPHPISGTMETVTFTREALVSMIRGPLYVPAFSAAIPHAIAQASTGNFVPIAGLAYALNAGGNEMAWGMHYAVICSEDAPRMKTSADKNAGDFSGIFANLYRDVCANWPHGDVPTAFYEIPAAQFPVLVMSGGADPVTPSRHGVRVAKMLGAKALHLVVPEAGHGVMGVGCARDVLHNFFNAATDAEALRVDVSCLKNVPRPTPFFPVATHRTGGEK